MDCKRSFAMNSFSLLTCSFVFQEDYSLLYWSGKSQKQTKRSWPLGHISACSLLSRFRRQQKCSTQDSRDGSGCKCFAFRQRGNFKTFAGWCCASCSCCGVTFSTCDYLDKAKYFCWGFLDSFLLCFCCTEILWVLRLFVEFLCADSDKGFAYKVANCQLTGWCKSGVIPGQ